MLKRKPSGSDCGRGYEVKSRGNYCERFLTNVSETETIGLDRLALVCLTPWWHKFYLWKVTWDDQQLVVPGLISRLVPLARLHQLATCCKNGKHPITYSNWWRSEIGKRSCVVPFAFIWNALSGWQSTGHPANGNGGGQQSAQIKGEGTQNAINICPGWAPIIRSNYLFQFFHYVLVRRARAASRQFRPRPYSPNSFHWRLRLQV